jgi:hypothetical protein
MYVLAALVSLTPSRSDPMIGRQAGPRIPLVATFISTFRSDASDAFAFEPYRLPPYPHGHHLLDGLFGGERLEGLR